MNEIVKNFRGLDLRIIDHFGEPWFVAVDVCRVLGLKNVGQALSSMPESEKNTITINDGIRGNPSKIIVNEPGLYRLIFKSRKKEAEDFKNWVLTDVLPAIRKNGAYVSPAITDSQMRSLWETLGEEISRRKDAERLAGYFQKQLCKISGTARPKRKFGEISKVTGLPMDKVIGVHLRSDRRTHEPQLEKYIQLALPFLRAEEMLSLVHAEYPQLLDASKA